MALPQKLKDLLRKAKGITDDSRKVEEGFIFFAIKGTKFDGHDFVGEVLKKNPLAVVVEREIPAKDRRIVKVESTKKALGESASFFFGEPSKELKVIGVTGTNGKTSTTYILEAILTEAGKKTGLLGTINYRLGEEVLGCGRTTPDPITWHRTLKEMKERGAEFIVAEVSSHALDQHRVWGTDFEAVVFTNLTQDHLDYHGDMENYYLSKKRLFDSYRYRFAVINTDDEYGRRIVQEIEGEVLTYGREGELRIESFETGFEGSRIELSFRGRKYTFRTNLVGEFQAYNLAGAIATVFGMGIGPQVVERALLTLYIPGRFEVLRSRKGFIAVVDYAHTPDAVYNVLRSLRKLARGRLITVFGAGGNRDRSKRPLMGRSAWRWSDLIILTSDNPRYEDPVSIIEDILKGIEDRSRVIVEPDRRRAIERAVNLAKEGDIVAVLGKGHEDYQEVKGVKYPFSDSEVLKEFL